MSTSETTTKNRPVADVRIGAIKAAIWAHPRDKGGVRCSMKVSRSYVDDRGNWHDTDSFNTRDLLVLSKLVNEAHTRCVEIEAGARRPATAGEVAA